MTAPPYQRTGFSGGGGGVWWLKVAASTLLIASGPLGWWIGYRAFNSSDQHLAAWITGVVWLGVAAVLVAAAWRYPRAVGWSLIVVGLLLMLWAWLVVAVSGWDERTPPPWVWGHVVWFLSAGVAPFAAGVLFASAGSLAARGRQSLQAISRLARAR